MDYFIQPVCELVMKCLWVPFVQQLGYLKNHKKKFEKLNNEAQDLYTRREDVNIKINGDTMSKIPSNECKSWLKKVESIENQVKNIEEEFKAKKRCLSGWCPDILSRMKLGKHIVTMIHDITTLKEASAFKGGVVVDAPLEIVERVPIPTIESQTSTDRTVQKILICLRDVNIQKIGVWGMGGVGKTTAMKNLNNLPEITQMFEIVIWVTVSKDGRVRKVQNEIVHRLGMHMAENESDVRVASKLFQKLETMKYLLLLDDVWSVVNLEEVGVPIPSRENGCKMVLTSRFRDVCNKMDTDEEIKVDVFSKEEAWNLFHKKVGEFVNLPSIKPLARDVVEECGGLPLLILVIGGSLRKISDVHVWRNVLEELRSATFGTGDMEEAVFARLKFSYDRLRNENVKNCFLYCALYPEDYEIPVLELIEHWKGEGFIDGIQNFDKAYDKGYTILNDLIDASLLERIDCEIDELFLRMHDVIRDLALRMTSPKGEGCRFSVRSGIGIEECTNEEEWEQVEKISLMNNKLCGLPQRPICTSLSTLLLQNNYHLRLIPESFFEHMHSLQFLNLSRTNLTMLPSSLSNLVSLRVLNLSETKLKMLPSSLCNLVSLQGLYLRDCPLLKTLPSEVGGLKRLEVLHLGDRIQYLPIEVRQLTRLRSLQVTFYIDDDDDDDDEQEEVGRRMFSDVMLSSFSLLEDLKLCVEGSFARQQWDEIVDVSMAEEVGSLKRLTSLEFNFPRMECLEHFLRKRSSWKDQHVHFTKFYITVGRSYIEDVLDRSVREKFHKHEGRRDLIWECGDDIPSAIMEILNQACGFYLKDHETAQKLSDFGIENMNGLHFCVLQDCNALETIIDGNGLTVDANVLPNIQQLFLLALPNLRNIREGPLLPPQSFNALTRLYLENCPNLRYIFPAGMIQHISNLEYLYVSDCQDFEEIMNEEDEITVDDGDDDRDVVLHPRLKILRLWQLPKLIRICKAVSITWPSLKEIQVYECPNLTSLPLSIVYNAPALSEISGEGERWEALEWVDDDTKEQFESLFKPW